MKAENIIETPNLDLFIQHYGMKSSLVELQALKEYAKRLEAEAAKWDEVQDELERLRSKENDFKCILESKDEQLIFKITAKVDEIANMISVKGGGEYNIFVPDAFKTTESDEEQLSNLSHDILNVLMASLNRRWNKDRELNRDDE